MLRLVGTRWASAPEAVASCSAQRGGHSCSSATSHSAAAIIAANSLEEIAVDLGVARPRAR